MNQKPPVDDQLPPFLRTEKGGRPWDSQVYIDEVDRVFHKIMGYAKRHPTRKLKFRATDRPCLVLAMIEPVMSQLICRTLAATELLDDIWVTGGHNTTFMQFIAALEYAVKEERMPIEIERTITVEELEAAYTGEGKHHYEYRNPHYKGDKS